MGQLMDDWRIFLYPLGFLSAIAFGARFIIQWLQSEILGKSTVTRLFWYLSLIGNILLTIHTFLQVQFHICLIQATNAVISWRNLNLMQNSKPQWSKNKVILLLMLTSLGVTLAFFLQEWLLFNELGNGNWIRIPKAPWDSSQNSSVSWGWHLLGTIGYILFSSRFWVQWWIAEKSHHSELPLSFWWLSLIGAIFSCAYFMRIFDTVNLIGPLIGLVPYIRNLMLMRNAKKVRLDS